MKQPDNVQRLYDAAKPSDYRKQPPQSGTADYSVNEAGSKLRDYARWLDENHDLSIGGLDVLVNNIVGAGIQVEPQAVNRRGDPLPRVNDKIRDLWNDWRRAPDITREMSLEELQRLACRTWLRDGEVFVEHIQGPNRANRGRTVPYCVRAMEPDWCPFEKNDDKLRIVHGIEKDVDGIPVAYYFLQEMGDPRYFRYATHFDTRRVPAERVQHLKFSRRLNQTRGVSILHGVITRLDDIKDAEESERIAMRVAAAYTAAIIRNPDMITGSQPSFLTEDGDISDRYKNRYMEMSPGMVWDNLLPGEEVKGIGLDRPNTNLIEFLADQNRRVAAGMGVSYSSLSKRYDGNYSSQRQEMQEQKPQYDRMRNQFISDFARPLYERFVFWAVESGQLSIPREVKPTSLTNADYRAPGMPWIDPKKENDADAQAVQSGFKSRHMVIRERGYDPEIVDQQIQADLFQQQPQQPQASNENETDSDDDN